MELKRLCVQSRLKIYPNSRSTAPSGRWRFRSTWYFQHVSKAWVDNPSIEVILSTGGTGLTGRDVSPEAFREIFDKEIEGFGELFRQLSFKKIGTSTLQSRAVAGVANGTYIFVLPGSPSACKDAWDDILVHQLDYRHKPCNFVEIMPRLLENDLGRSGKN